MEWIWPAIEVLKGRVALIQVASESRIALFHIGRHHGDTVDMLIAPSLRALIEDPAVLKTGQSIMGDFWRLNKYFQLQPQGAFELSYFHTLIDQGRHNFETSYYPQGLKGLIEKYFPGYTLKKDEGMHQDWLAPLENPDLKAYAVADAYAGLMLYHRMNAKRLEMKPYPPLPARVEETRLYSEYSPGIPEPKPIYLQPLHPSGSGRQARWFFSMEEDNEVSTDLDTDSEALYNRLVECRERVAGEVEIYPRQLTTNCALRTIALTRPKTSDDCMKLRGLFPQLRKILAKQYAKVVTSFQEEIQRAECEQKIHATATHEQARCESLHVVADTEGTASDRPSVPTEGISQLHTGLSPSMKAKVTTADDAKPEKENNHLEIPKNAGENQRDENTDNDGDAEPENDANETGNSLEKKDKTDFAAGPPQAVPTMHTGLSFSMATAELDGEDTGAGAEEERGMGKREHDTPLKRKRSSSPESGRQLPAKSA